MQITILESTGPVGKAVVKEALKLGYQVKVRHNAFPCEGQLRSKVVVFINY